MYGNTTRVSGRKHLTVTFSLPLSSESDFVRWFLLHLGNMTYSKQMSEPGKPFWTPYPNNLSALAWSTNISITIPCTLWVTLTCVYTTISTSWYLPCMKTPDSTRTRRKESLRRSGLWYQMLTFQPLADIWIVISYMIKVLFGHSGKYGLVNHPQWTTIRQVDI